jgi:hypothetical protein
MKTVAVLEYLKLLIAVAQRQVATSAVLVLWTPVLKAQVLMVPAMEEMAVVQEGRLTCEAK